MVTIKAILKKIKNFSPFDDINGYPDTFREELNNQSNKILLFATIVLLFVWIPYIPVDLRLHPEEPLIIALRIGLSILGFVLLILYLAKKTARNGMLFLTLAGVYLELATGLITALSKGDPVYIGGYLFVLCLLAVIPIQVSYALATLAASVVLFFIVGFLKGMSFSNANAMYSLRDLITTSVVTAFFIFLLNKMRYRNWRNARKIYKQREKLKYYEEIITNIPIGISRLTLDGYLESANNAFCRMFGIIDQAYLIRNNISQYFSNPAEWEKIAARLIANEQLEKVEILFRRPDRSTWWGCFSANLFRNLKGEPYNIDIIISDTTKEKIAEEELNEANAALHANEEKYRHLVENSHDIIYTLTMRGRFSFVSPSWTLLLGHSTEQVLGEPFNAFVHPDDITICRKYFIDVVTAKNHKYGLEYRIRHYDGSWRWHMSNGVAVHDESGKIIGFEGISSDITERKKIEVQRNEALNALRRSEEKFRKIVNTLPQFISIWDMNMNCTYVSPSVYHLTGYTPKERINLKREEFLSPEDIIQQGEKLKQALIEDSMPDRDLNKVVTTEEEETRKDGSKVMLQTTYTFLRDENDVPVGILTLSADITERKRAELAVIESEQRLADIINFLPLPTLVIDIEGKVTAWNHSIEELTGIKSENMIGKGDYEYALPFYGERRPILIDFVFTPDEDVREYNIQIKNEGGIFTSESFIPFIGSRGIYIEGFAAALYDSNGNAVGAIESIRDITKIKQTESDLKDAKEAAEAANQSKSAFLANMSHEIRTPMNAILGFAEILSNKMKEPELVNYTGIIISSGNALLAIINDILDLSKIEAGKLELRPSFVDLKKMIQEVKKLFKPKADEKGLELIAEISDDFPQSVYLDEIRVIQIIMNLMGNAIKFTSKGYVKICIEAKYPPGRQTGIEENSKDIDLRSDIIITIEDTGIGIPGEQIEKIFKPFEQADGQSTRRFGGTGLGLSISTKLIEMMGGTIDVISDVGKGSKFIINVPGIKLSDKSTDEKLIDDLSELDVEFEPSHILVVDDLEVNRDLVKVYLEEYELILTECENGESALEEVRENRFDLILLDRKMPGIDGEEVARILKNDEKTKDIPIVIFTASALKEEEERIRTIADSFLTKPVNKLKLVQEMKKYLPYKVKAKMAEEVSVDYKEENEDVILPEKKKELLRLLEDEYYKEWKNVNKIKAIGSVKAFANNLLSTADKYGSGILRKYSMELLESAALFKVSKLKNILNDFPNLIKKIGAP